MIEANNSGLAMITIATTSTAVIVPNTINCSAEMANRLPNSTLVTLVVLSVAIEANSTPSEVAKASTVPVATSRRSTRLPNAPIARPPATQNTARPSVTGAPIKAAPVAPGNPMWARAWAAKASRRTTTKYPTNPEANATSVPPMNAWRMKVAPSTSIQLFW